METKEDTKSKTRIIRILQGIGRILGYILQIIQAVKPRRRK